MCDDYLLKRMKGLQVKAILTCNPGPQCWCNNLSFRFPVVENEDCLSPKEMLYLYEKEMSIKDVTYLKSIINYEFRR